MGDGRLREVLSCVVRLRICLVCISVCLFHSTSPEEFNTRLEEHHKQESVEKQRSGENRKFSSLSEPKEEIAKCPSSAFTRQKVRTFLFMILYVKKNV